MGHHTGLPVSHSTPNHLDYRDISSGMEKTGLYPGASHETTLEEQPQELYEVQTEAQSMGKRTQDTARCKAMQCVCVELDAGLGFNSPSPMPVTNSFSC